MKQSIEERKLHHQTREDRQRRVYEQLGARIADIKSGRPIFYRNGGVKTSKLPVYERELAHLAVKLGI